MAATGPIVASAKYDPGLQDVFNAHGAEMHKHGDEEMKNLVCGRRWSTCAAAMREGGCERVVHVGLYAAMVVQ